MSVQSQRTRAELFKHGVLVFILSFAFYPLLVMVAISFKDNDQYNLNPYFFDWPSEWHVSENWGRGWRTVQDAIANSIVTSVGAVVLAMVMAVLTSYVLARYRFPGRNLVYYRGSSGQCFCRARRRRW